MNTVNDVGYAICECNDAWAGIFCTERVDECAGNPCYENVTCTLPPAPATGYQCGPCPGGLQGDGQKCFGKNNQVPYVYQFYNFKLCAYVAGLIRCITESSKPLYYK